MNPARKLHLQLLATGIVIIAIINSAAGEPSSVRAGSEPEFTFVRMKYSSALPAMQGYGYRQRGRWQVDWPQAEYHFLQGLQRLTRVNTAADGIILSLLDDELFDYPWLYVLEVGSWVLHDEEVRRLREYLLRGGFLMIDDFHGSLEWAGFMFSMRKVFPDRPVVEIREDDEVLHLLYDLDERIQIPGISAYWSGRTHERDGVTPHWRGIYDGDGRLMVAINFNMDIGDAWEHADNPNYPEPMTALAYRFGINYVIYAMTH